MLNEDFFDDKDKKILQLTNTINAYKKYDQEQKEYRFELEKEIHNLRYQVDDLKAQLDAFCKDPSIEAIKKLYEKKMIEQMKYAALAKEQAAIYSRKINALSNSDAIVTIMNEYSSNQISIMNSLAIQRENNKKLTKTLKNLRKEFSTFVNLIHTKGQIDSKRIDELIEILKEDSGDNK